MTDTVLTLSGIGIVPLSGGGIRESLSPIGGGQLLRNVNGTLVDLSLALHRKYRVTLTGGDVLPAALAGVWQGQTVTIGCITQLAKALTLAAGAGSIVLDRTPVTGSGRAVVRVGTTERFVDATFHPTGGNYYADVDFADASLSGEAFVYFRPSLACMVTALNADTDEYGAAPGWTLELEEV